MRYLMFKEIHKKNLLFSVRTTKAVVNINNAFLSNILNFSGLFDNIFAREVNL